MNPNDPAAPSTTPPCERVISIDDPKFKRVCGQPSLKGTVPPRCYPHLMGGVRRGLSAKWVKQYLQETDIPNIHPMDSLLEVVRWSGAMVRTLGCLVGELPVDPVLQIMDGFGSDENEQAPPTPVVLQEAMWGLDHNGDQAPHILLKLYGEWTERHARVCKAALDAGIDERIVRNAENTSIRLKSAFTRALDSIPLTDEQRRLLAQALAVEIRAELSPTMLPLKDGSSPQRNPTTPTSEHVPTVMDPDIRTSALPITPSSTLHFPDPFTQADFTDADT